VEPVEPSPRFELGLIEYKTIVLAINTMKAVIYLYTL
jgi:hypothetical protein